MTSSLVNVQDICALASPQVAVVGDRLYIDGRRFSYVNTVALNRSQGPWTDNDLLYYIDFDSYLLRGVDEPDITVHSIDKPSGVPTSDAGLWVDSTGLRGLSGVDEGGWTYDAEAAKFDTYTLNLPSAKPEAQATTPEGVMWYLTSESEVQQLVSVDLESKEVTTRNITEFSPIFGGNLVYAPMGQAGILVTVGGRYIQADTLVPFKDIFVYDIFSDQWAKQTATDQNTTTPALARDHDCAVGAYDEASESFQIVMYGGTGADGEHLDGIRALSIPDFTIFMYNQGFKDFGPTNHTCALLNDRYMTLVGGVKEDSCEGDWFSPFRIEWFDISNITATANDWDSYDPDLKGYTRPPLLDEMLDGRSEPERGWNSDIVEAMFKNTTTKASGKKTTTESAFATKSSSSPTSSAEAASNASDSVVPEESKSTNAGAIAGGVIGGLAGLGLVGVAFFMYRRKKQNQQVRQELPGNSMATLPRTDSEKFSTNDYYAKQAASGNLKELGGSELQSPSSSGPPPYSMGAAASVPPRDQKTPTEAHELA